MGSALNLKGNQQRSTKPRADRVQMSYIHPVGSTTIAYLFSCLQSNHQKIRDTLKRKNEEENEEVEETRFSTPGLKKKTDVERKIALSFQCTEAITKKPVESSDSKHSAFALYVDEKLCKLGKHDQRIAEKRITDVLLAVEMQSEREEPLNRQMIHGCYGNNFYRNVKCKC